VRVTVTITLLAALLLARRRWLVVRVGGHSMTPTYADGDRLLVSRRSDGWRRGMVVVGRPPGIEGALFVKRLAALEGDSVMAEHGATTVPAGHCWVLGDAPNSGDSRHWGPVPLEGLVGVVSRRMSFR
jgi:signal peptidase I